MQNTGTVFDEIPNIGFLDRSFRIAVGAVAIIAVLANQNTGMLDWLALVPLLAVYPIMTGLIAYDPLYAWLGINTRKSSVFSDEQLVRIIRSITGEENPPATKTPDDIKKQTTGSRRNAA
ncbi:MAG TPA: DUF2892 domain-containing protein [Gammaproteobacteria bacterium]